MYHVKVLLKRFQLNGHTIGFHPQTQKVQLHTKQIAPCEVLLKRFHLNGHTIGFHPQTPKLELRTKHRALCESTAEEVSFEWLHHRISSTDSKVGTTYKT